MTCSSLRIDRFFNQWEASDPSRDKSYKTKLGTVGTKGTQTHRSIHTDTDMHTYGHTDTNIYTHTYTHTLTTNNCKYLTILTLI